eukprot:6082341-Pleurochrysis_carterae.AAC.1
MMRVPMSSEGGAAVPGMGSRESAEEGSQESGYKCTELGVARAGGTERGGGAIQRGLEFWVG